MMKNKKHAAEKKGTLKKKKKPPRPKAAPIGRRRQLHQKEWVAQATSNGK